LFIFKFNIIEVEEKKLIGKIKVKLYFSKREELKDIVDSYWLMKENEFKKEKELKLLPLPNLHFLFNFGDEIDFSTKEELGRELISFPSTNITYVKFGKEIFFFGVKIKPQYNNLFDENISKKINRIENLNKPYENLKRKLKK